LSLIVFLAGLGRPVVSRTQEARVLETAREMLGKGWRGWMVPRLNDEVRLQKPPLAYWLSAGSFKAFGVNEFAGRLPFALAGCLTLAATYGVGRRLVGDVGALIAAAALPSFFMFFRFARLAETDILAALFVTAAIYFILIAEEPAKPLSRILRWNIAGACVALAVLAKGPPGVFPVLFLLAWAGVRRVWRPLLRSVTHGTWLTALLVAGWWFAYVRSLPEWRVMEREVEIITRGSHHNASFLNYFPWTLTGTAPWSAIVVLGLAWLAFHMIDRPPLRTLLAWALVIFVPLCIAGQRQQHYLLPFLPVAALALGYAAAHALADGSPPHDRRLFRWLFDLTLAVSCGAGIAVIAGARSERGMIQTHDLLIAAALTVIIAAVVWVRWRRGLGAGVAAYALAAAIAFTAIFGFWIPTTNPDNHRAAAQAIRAQFGDGPYVLYGQQGSEPMLWNLRSVVPEIRTQEELADVLRQQPGTVVIAQTKNNRPPPPLPPNLEKRLERRVGDEGMVFEVYAPRGR
jgi:4-amino-4-deoxy-L-arabinose transferase-like glycosyltransferase